MKSLESEVEESNQKGIEGKKKYMKLDRIITKRTNQYEESGDVGTLLTVMSYVLNIKYK